MPTIKIKRLTYDATDTFQTLKNFITLDTHGNLVVKDVELAEAFDNMESNYNYSKELETKIQGLEKNIDDNTGLSIKSSDLKKQVQGRDKEISSLQRKIKDLEQKIQSSELEIQSLKDKNDTSNNTIQELQSNIESLKGERDELSKELQKEEDIKTTFNKWGTYVSLQKDATIIRFFMNRPDTDVRQKTVIKHFKNIMAVPTLRKHLYGLVEKRILSEPEFKGTYRFNFSSSGMPHDMDRLAQLILGQDLFEMAVDHHNKKLED